MAARPARPASSFKSTRQVLEAEPAAAPTIQESEANLTIASSLPPLEAVYNVEDLLPYWQLYLDHIRQQDKIALASILASRVLSFQAPNQVLIPFVGTVEEGKLTKVRHEIEKWMRQTTQLLGLEVVLYENHDSEAYHTKPVSDSDKYQAMVNKYPALEILRQRLMLDFG